MKNRYYIITSPDRFTNELDRVKIVVDLEDYVGFTYSNSKFADNFGQISYMEKSKFKDMIIKDLGTAPEWSPDEITDDFTRSIS